MSLIYLCVCRPVAECAALVAKSLRKNTEGCAEGKSRIGWLLSGLGCGKSEGNVEFLAFFSFLELG